MNAANPRDLASWPKAIHCPYCESMRAEPAYLCEDGPQLLRTRRGFLVSCPAELHAHYLCVDCGCEFPASMTAPSPSPSPLATMIAEQLGPGLELFDVDDEPWWCA